MKLDPDHQKCRLALKTAKKCEELKEEGNKNIKAKNIDEAIKNYTEALTLDPCNKKLNAIIYSNRALAYLKQKKDPEALADCNKSIELNDHYYKSYLRRAEAKMNMGE
jgi:DnaJ family protein C protein 7